MTEGLLIYALFIIIAFGALSIAMLGVIAARRKERDVPNRSADEVLRVATRDLYRYRAYLRDRQRWEGGKMLGEETAPRREDSGSSAAIG